jgi:hypothetical protein
MDEGPTCSKEINDGAIVPTKINKRRVTTCAEICGELLLKYLPYSYTEGPATDCDGATAPNTAGNRPHRKGRVSDRL